MRDLHIYLQNLIVLEKSLEESYLEYASLLNNISMLDKTKLYIMAIEDDTCLQKFGLLEESFKIFMKKSSECYLLIKEKNYTCARVKLEDVKKCLDQNINPQFNNLCNDGFIRILKAKRLK